MHFVRTAFIFLLMMTFLPVSAVWAAGSLGAGGDDVYDRLKAGVKITQERLYETPEQPTVYLTFDDGPGKLTPKVLDILRDEKVTATFFVLGEHVKQYPDSIKRMAEEGHSIGNHTYNHQYNNLYPVFKMFWGQIEQTDQALQEAAGVNTNLIRAPGGTFSHFDAFYFYYLDQAGYSVFDWNVDSGDSLRANVPMAEIVRNATSTALKHEMIVLMHDSSGHDETVRALPEIIRFYKERGYKFAPLSAKVKPIQSVLDKQKKTMGLSREEHEQWMQNMQDNAALKAGQNVTLPAKVQAGAATISPTAGKASESAALSVAAASAAQVKQEEHSVTQLVYQGEWAIKKSSSSLKQIHTPPLRLQIGRDTLEMDASRYEFRDDKLYVPLRSLAERMGAMVSWEGERRTASVKYGTYEMKVDLQNHSISIEAPGRAKQVYYMADVSMRDGSVVVPLRKAVELLGNRVEGYSLSDSLREVKLDTSSKGYSLICIPKLTVKV
jgi:peptidoglycan-N-acetylglucosamine deacetylase